MNWAGIFHGNQIPQTQISQHVSAFIPDSIILHLAFAIRHYSGLSPTLGVAYRSRRWARKFLSHFRWPVVFPKVRFLDCFFSRSILMSFQNYWTDLKVTFMPMIRLWPWQGVVMTKFVRDLLMCWTWCQNGLSSINYHSTTKKPILWFSVPNKCADA